MLSARLGSHTSPQELDRSNDGQDHTVLPYARSPFRRRVRQHRARSHRNTDETNFTAPLVRTRPRAHRDYPPCPHPLLPTLPRPPQARLAYRDDVRSPLKDEPGWATHTPFPNFGKVEYFYADGLTARQVFCPSGYGRELPGKIPGCERQVQHLPLLVFVHRQHLVRLTGLKRGRHEDHALPSRDGFFHVVHISASDLARRNGHDPRT